ncbi:MAG: type II toxin-antitoxin system VapC family toxin [Armatimonadetes bacterium]|nr:type II toxin-antitoxin system VapC family toxin [Armatimonadota bacterium]
MATMKSRRREVFADSAGWGNLFDAGEPYHQEAIRLYQEIRRQGGRLVTTNYVMAETVSQMISPLRMPRASMVGFISGLKASPHVEIVHVDPDLDTAAWQLLTQRPDKEWSLVDCASFVVMQQRGITDALTTDRHFEQAGFGRLLS